MHVKYALVRVSHERSHPERHFRPEDQMGTTIYLVMNVRQQGTEKGSIIKINIEKVVLWMT